MAGSGGTPGTLFCDTNVLLRVLTDDPPGHGAAAEGALREAGGGRFRIALPDLVLAELAYVLIGPYGLTVEEAAARMSRILDVPGIEVLDEPMLRDAIDTWATGTLDFADAYLAALSRRTPDAGVLSFDRDFDRLDGVVRVDPRALRG